MCLLILAYQCRSDYPLIIAANRDEFLDRPARPLDFWPDCRDILAGRDLQGGGTWMGLHRSGRLAAITNFREPDRFRPQAPSRGHLVRDFIGGAASPADYLAALRRDRHRYNGFNLVVGGRDALYYYGNRGAAPAPIAAGVHGLSNHLMDTPWPKVERAKAAMAAIVRREDPPGTEALMTLLQDRHLPPDEALPATGVGLEWERLLSTAFIQSSAYGTRCSSVLMMASDGRTRFVERTFTPGDQPRTRRFTLQIPV